MKSGGRDNYRGDLLIAIALLALVWIASVYLDLFEIIHGLLHDHEDWQLDELLLALLILSLVALWFSYRRWQEAEQADINAQKFNIQRQTYDDLINHMNIAALIYKLEDIDDDKTLKLIHSNPAASAFTGTDVHALHNQYIDQAFPGLRKQGLPQKYADVVRRGESLVLESLEYSDERVQPAVFSVRAFPLPEQCVGIVFENISARVRAEQRVKFDQELLDAVRRAQALFIADQSPQETFTALLTEFLSVTGSEYGFIGRVLNSDENQPYLKVFTLTDISWDEASRRLYDKYADSGMEFTNLDSLFGTVMKTGEVVISNNPADDPRGCGLPHGHPALNAFLGIPLYSGSALIGMAGIANRPEGYDLELIEMLRPLSSACAQMIQAFAIDQEKERITEELEHTQRRHEEAQHVARIGHWELDLIHNDLIWSKENYRIFGDDFGHANSYETFLERVHPDDREFVSSAYADSVENRTPYDIEHRLLMEDGSVKWVHEQCHTEYDKDDTALRSIGTVQDITKRKLAEIEMAESRKRFSGIIELAADAIISVDQSGQIELFNQAAEEIFGYSSDEVLGQSINMLIPERFHISHGTHMGLFADSESSTMHQAISSMFRVRRDGEEVPIEASISLKTLGGKRVLTVLPCAVWASRK